MKKIILFFLISVLIISSFKISGEVIANNNNIIALKKIYITPTDIASYKNNNYLYFNDNKMCIKVDNIKLKDEFQECLLNNENNYLIKDNCYEFELSKFKIEGKNKIVHSITINFQTFFKFGDFQYEIKNNNDEIKLFVDKIVENNKKDYFISFNNVNSSRKGVSYKIVLQYEVL